MTAHKKKVYNIFLFTNIIENFIESNFNYVLNQKSELINIIIFLLVNVNLFLYLIIEYELAYLKYVLKQL